MGEKFSTGAVVFLLIFIMINGLMDNEFKARHQPMFTAFAVSRLLLLAALYASD